MAGGGKIFEVAPSGLFRSDDPSLVAGEVNWMGQVAERTGLTVTFIMLHSHDQPDRWRDEIAEAKRWTANGARVMPLVAARSASILYGGDIRHPFMARPSYRQLAGLPLAERVAALRDPVTRAAILNEADQIDRSTVANELRFLRNVLPMCFAMSGNVVTRRHGVDTGARPRPPPPSHLTSFALKLSIRGSWIRCSCIDRQRAGDDNKENPR